MTDFLSELVNRGLVTKVDGDDLKLAKIQEASNTLATEFTASPRRLIPAILAGTDPDVPPDDPEVVAADASVLQQWSTMRTVHTNSVNLARAVLLDACFQAAQGPLAAVVWLTAIDQLPFMRLGAEGAAVRERLDALAITVETQALAGIGGEKSKPPKPVKIPEINLAKAPSNPNVNKAALLKSASATFPFSPPAVHLQHLSSFINEWMGAFPDRLSTLLTDIAQSAEVDYSQFNDAFAEVTAVVEKSLNAQRKWIRAAQNDYEVSSRVWLRALWWAEALYSPSLRTSYRQFPPTVATFIMSFDLAAEVGATAPASVGYLLAETIAKLPSCSFDEARTVWSILDELREQRGQLPREWLDPIESPTKGRLSVRDLAVLALHEDGSRYETAKNELRLRFEQTMSLPNFGHAIHRQEQAYRIVQGLK